MPARDSMLRHPQMQMRIRIAQVAAQLIAEHGIQDYALAKRKAARQLGAPDSHHLPSNEEVDAALRDHQALYAPEEHAAILATLRQQALAVMHALERFNPFLVGNVLQGTVSRHTDIEIELYADASKDFEQHLLNHGIEFKVMDRGGQSVYLLYADPADVRVRVLPAEQHHATGGGRQEPLRRATASQLSQLLQDEATPFG